MVFLARTLHVGPALIGLVARLTLAVAGVILLACPVYLYVALRGVRDGEDVPV